ncbi:glycosyltransferase family 24 protein [Pleurotus eryngii]|uniref:Glycosyltransferase family 24 protein n=1 Tax=Pleurotus eryngii TaxID=5323 RepID=A0A9P6D8D9_PLEER|nr:glycosyltransferase family 24 protein [Pleurotus eryngii]
MTPSRGFRRVAVLLALPCLARSSSPPVRVSLRSSWPAPPPIVEILETVALQTPSSFFPLLDTLTDPDSLANFSSLSPEALYQASIEVASENGLITDAGAFATVEMNFALHAATPKIEAFYHHYSNMQSKVTLKPLEVEAKEPQSCGSWVDWYGQVVCDVETLTHLAGIETIDPSIATPDYTRPKVLPFDHINPSPQQTLHRPHRTAILYASLESPNFRELHACLFSLSNRGDPRVEYILRYVPPAGREVAQRNYLSGYGVALDLKKTDYLVVDDRQASQSRDGSQGEQKDGEDAVDLVMNLIETFEDKKSGAPNVASALSEEEIAELGFQATQLIATSDDPLGALTQLSQNFPKYAPSLSRRVVVNDSVRQEIGSNQVQVQGGINMMWLNGASVQDKDVTPFALLRLIQRERQIVDSLTSLGLSNGQAVELLTHPTIAEAQSSSATLDGMFDASDRIEGGDVIVFWNDIEKDKRYARWTTSLLRMMHPTYPGMFHNIKLNIYNVILVIDLSQPTALNFVTGPVSNIIERNFPFRFGIVPILETENGTKMAKVFKYLVKTVGRKATMEFFRALAQSPTFDIAHVSVAYEAFRASLDSEDISLKPLTEIFSPEAESDESLTKAKHYAQRLGTTLASSEGGHAFINGKHFNLDDGFLRHLQTESGLQTTYLQERLYTGELKEDAAETISTYFYDLPSTNERRNRHIYPSSDANSLRIYSLPEVLADTGYHPTFIAPEETEDVPMSTYVVADFDSSSGIQLAIEALKSMTGESQTRLTFVLNPASVPSSDRSSVSWLLSHLVASDRLSKVTPGQLLRALNNYVTISGDATQAPLSQVKELVGVDAAEFDATAYAAYVKAGLLISRKVHLRPGQQGLVVNGRVVGPLPGGEFLAPDFLALMKYEHKKRFGVVAAALREVLSIAPEPESALFSNIATMVTSVTSSIQLPDPSESGLFDTPQRPRRRAYQALESNLTAFSYGDNTTAIYQLAVLVDPLSETGQKWASILNWISKVPGIFTEVYLNPARYREMPLKRFYRYNLVSSLTFDTDGNEMPSQVVFEGLPIEPIYTLAMDVPSSWLVRPQEALYDLDNIQLGRLSSEDTTIDAVFGLDYLVIEGHARDSVSNAPPRGVQLELIDGDDNAIDDTLVVANLGYVQFKAKPGVFQLQIRKGRGRDIFEMESVGNEGWDSPTVKAVGSEITLTSFEGLTLYPRLRRREGMEDVDVLADTDEEDAPGMFGGLASKVMSMFSPKEGTKDVATTVPQADINIFTVASGLLYERFASIMILSVLRNTKSTVKFWFIENFLSPSFLEFIPHFAEEYGFQYELVTYKWPSWLRQQKEKQRVIWAYKILFLDVLFPMDLKKVLFVDADQIVRADLKELVDLDIQGAPYAYTPMGDDNYDMEGFRFWKTGYWKEFLQGRPYHISALYVVDLVRFRQIAAGDMLRGQYQQLSADPNSLANLDQDLPNNLQREVPIFSLHEDWLWCETWCSKDRLHKAKTIDLCQNPLTKEPKLSRARQIPEWEEYDVEISHFAQKLAKEGSLHSRIAAADTRVLADAGTASSGKSDEISAEAGGGDAASNEAAREKGESPKDIRDEL